MRQLLTDDLDLAGHHLVDWRYMEDIPQSGATTGQAIVWTGSKWAPGTVASSVTTDVYWDDVLNKPTTFAPSAHTHVVGDITDWLTTALKILSLDVIGGVLLNSDMGSLPFATAPSFGVLDSSATVHRFFYADDIYVGWNVDGPLWVGVTGAPYNILHIGDDTVVGGTLYIGSDNIKCTVANGFGFSRKISVTGNITSSGAVVTDTISENSSGAGVTVDGVKLKDSEVYTDVIHEKTSGAGVTADGVLLKDNAVTKAWTTLGTKTLSTSSFSLTNTAGFDTGTYIAYNASISVNAAASSLAVQTLRGVVADMTFTNNTPTLFLPTVHAFSSSINAGGMNISVPSGSTQPVHFIFTNPGSAQAFSEGYLSVDVSGTTGDVVAAYTRSRVSGSASGYGYRGYAVDASGSTGIIVGVNGYAVMSTGSTSAAVMAFDATIIGSAVAYDKRMSFRGSNHMLVRGGSLFLASGTPATPNAVTTSHLTPGSANSELYVAGAAEVDGEMFMDGNTSISVATTTSSSYNAGTSTLIRADATGGNITVNLPAASGRAGRMYIVKKVDSSVNTVTIDANASETIDGATTVVLTTQYEVKRLVCNGTNWDLV